jgi:PGF-pre-PGF domain-containing protein
MVEKSRFMLIVLMVTILSSAIIVYAAMDTVSLVTPEDNHVNWNGTVTFSCNVTSNATLDTLYLYMNINGTWDTNGTVATPSNRTAYNFTNAYTDVQKANWTCWANNTEGAELWSADNNYTITIDNTNPAGFNFTNPANMTTTNFTTNTTPLLDWNDTVDPNFLNYTILITDSNNFGSPNYTYEVHSTTVNVSNSSFRIGTDTTANTSTSTALEDGIWFWKVIAYDGAGANGSTEQATNISIDDGTNVGYYEYRIDTIQPTKSEPSNTSTVFDGNYTNDTTPEINWTVTTEANFLNYTINVSNSSTFEVINYTTAATGAITNNSVNLSTIESDGTWYWRIIVYDVIGNSNVSAQNYSFILDSIGPTKAEPSNTSDIDDGTYTNDTTPEINWTASTETNFANYTIRVSNSSAFDTTNYTTSTLVATTNNSVNLTLEDGTWYWRVIVYDLADNFNTSATNYSFTVDTVEPSKAEPATPVEGTNTSDNTTEFNWTTSAETNFRNYTVQISEAANFTVINYTASVTTSNATRLVNSSALAEGTWYWRVITYDLVNHSNISSTNFSLVVDVTNPTVSFSCDSRSVYVNTLITCGCTSTDNIDSAPTVTFTTNPSTSASGSFSTSCTSTDDAGNSATESIDYTVATSPSVGGSSTPASTTSKSVMFSNVREDDELTATTSDDRIHITEVTVTAAEDANSVKVAFKNYDSKPSSVSEPTAKVVYQYLDVTADIEIKRAEINFEVEDSWLTDNGITSADVVLLHYVDDDWEELLTRHVSGESYMASSLSLSTFAIAAGKEKPVDKKAESKPIIEEIVETFDKVIPEESSVFLPALVAVGIVLVVVFYAYSSSFRKRTDSSKKNIQTHVGRLHKEVKRKLKKRR